MGTGREINMCKSWRQGELHVSQITSLKAPQGWREEGEKTERRGEEI